MKVLAATRRTQGKRPTDVAEAIEGELVWMVEPCFYSRRHPLGECDCGRTFRGMYSDAVTTTAIVTEIEGFTRGDYITARLASRQHEPGCTCALDAEVTVDDLIARADRLPIGAVVERQIDRVIVRQLADASR